MLTTPAITRLQGPGPRHYQVEGYSEPFPSVTTVLSIISKLALVPWACNVALASVRATLVRVELGGLNIRTNCIDGVLAYASILHGYWMRCPNVSNMWKIFMRRIVTKTASYKSWAFGVIAAGMKNGS